VRAIFSAPVQTGPGAHPASCTMGTGSFPGVKNVRGVTLTPHLLLLQWSWKTRAIPLLLLWAVRPVQSLSACTRVTFTFWHVYVVGGVWKKKSRNIVTSSHPVLIRVWGNMMLEQWNLLETLTLTLATYTHVWARKGEGGGRQNKRYPLRR